MTIPIDLVVASLKSRDCKSRKSGDGWEARCPAHDDKRASLSVSDARDGKVLLHCHAGCQFSAIVNALNLKTRDLFPPKDPGARPNGVHRAKDKPAPAPLSGALARAMAEALRKDTVAWKHVTEVLRFSPEVIAHLRLGLCVDRQGRRWLAYPYWHAGAWTYSNCRSLNGEKEFIRFPRGQKTHLYLADWLKDGGTAVILEGERDAAAALTLGLGAELGEVVGAAVVSMPGVEQVEVAAAALAKQKRVYLFTDNDQPGEVAAEKLAARLGPERCRRVRLNGFKDLGDLLSARGVEKAVAIAFQAFRRAEEEGPFRSRADQPKNGATTQSPWTLPIPFADHQVPDFPVTALPEPLRSYVTALATSTQTPIDLSAIISLSALATALAKKARIALADDWTEPLNLFTAVVLPPGSRKSAVFAAVTGPVEEFEREEATRLEPQRREALDAYEVAQARLKRAKDSAAKAKDDKRDRAIEEVKRLSTELAAMKVPAPFRLLADDCTPEKLSTLLRDHDGRMALLSPEGGVFELMAGRYSDAPNLEVYLKGHSGDDLRVDRVNRPPEFVKRPALTIGLAIQPDVLQGLKDKPGFRGRGLLGRFLYALPRNTVGSREIEPPSLPPMVHAAYYRDLQALLRLADGSNVIRLSAEARGQLCDFMRQLEPRLGAAGDLAVITDWAAKLAGAIGRIAGLLHLAEIRTQDAFEQRVSADTMQRALSIGQYLILHAQAAFAEMGADPDTEGAQRILAWLRRTAPPAFTKRDAHQALRGTFRRAEDLDGPLSVLDDRGYIRALPEPEQLRPGRKRSPTYEVHPLLSQYSQSSERQRGFNSEECEESVRVGPELRA